METEGTPRKAQTSVGYVCRFPFFAGATNAQSHSPAHGRSKAWPSSLERQARDVESYASGPKRPDPTAKRSLAIGFEIFYFFSGSFAGFACLRSRSNETVFDLSSFYCQFCCLAACDCRIGGT